MVEKTGLSKGKKKFSWKRLTNTYRLIVLNDETFEEAASFRLSRLNVFILVSTILVLFALMIVSAIVYTPLKEYIPGYSDVNSRRQLMELKLKSDSLEQLVQSNAQFLQNLKMVLSGKLPVDKMRDTVISAAAVKYDSISLDKISPSETKLRSELEQEQRFSIGKISSSSGKKPSIKSFYFFTPLKGYVTEPFNAAQQHFGIDIVAPENSPIKATMDGIVILAGWTAETGYIMAIQHTNNLISLYKHNSALLKEEGNYVKAGDVIAIIGNTGEFSSGPHLHFELWFNGIPLNPEDYLVF